MYITPYTWTSVQTLVLMRARAYTDNNSPQSAHYMLVVSTFLGTTQGYLPTYYDLEKKKPPQSRNLLHLGISI